MLAIHRRGGEEDADSADREEQQGLVVAFPSAAVLERPFAVENVTEDRRENSGQNLGDYRLLFEDREAQRIEDREVEDHGGAAHNRELDQFVMAQRESPERLGNACKDAVDK